MVPKVLSLDRILVTSFDYLTGLLRYNEPVKIALLKIGVKYF